jgi:DNA-binding cell septation regulator SpoVG
VKIIVKWFSGEKPSFNVSLASAEGKPEFLTIKGVRIVDGSKGPFLSFPARKMDDGKWFSHVWASEAFQSAVLAEAEKAKPKDRAKDEKYRAGAPDDDDIPW